MNDATRYDIAIVGMACSLPEAPDVGTFWRNLETGRCSIRARSRRAPDGSQVVEAWAPLDDIEGFDTARFAVNPHDAALLDPQHRRLLECCATALEDANLVAAEVGRIGLYAGCGPSTYLHNVLRSAEGRTDYSFLDSLPALQAFMSTDRDFVVSQVAYRLGFRGPCVNVQGTCATSLVAIHQACQSLLVGECDVALAGAAFVHVPQSIRYVVEPGMALSADGRCRPFDREASGTVFGSGAGAVVLKRLEDAQRDGDPIHAVILGSAVNNDGATKVGIAAPSRVGQREVIEEALRVASVAPHELRFVEAHGTATELGDPLEVAALTDVLREFRGRSCALQSVKANIGHLSYAAGMAGLIKTVLCLSHRRLPAAVGFGAPNPHIDFARTSLFVNQHPLTWPGDDELVAGVSAFGLGGVNAHVVLASAPNPEPRDSLASGHGELLCLGASSARTLEALSRDNIQALARPGTDWRDHARTSVARRPAWHVRRAIVADTAAEAAAQLAMSLTELEARPGGLPRRIAFVFSGQGNEQHGMAAALYEHDATFRHFVDEHDDAFERACGSRLAHLLSAPGPDLVDASLELRQPMTFALQVGLARAWEAWGVVPEAVAGFSLGEYAAACLAGSLNVDDGIALTATRGALLQERTLRGAMLAIYQPRQVAAELIHQAGLPVDVAGDLGDVCTLVAGESGVVDALAKHLRAARVATRLLPLHRAGHSRLVDPMLAPFTLALQAVRWGSPSMDWITAAGERPGSQAIPNCQHWLDHTRGPVRFGAALDALRARGIDGFIEIGAGNSLQSAIQSSSDGVAAVATLEPGVDSRHSFLRAAGRVFEWGLDLRSPELPLVPCRLPVAGYDRRRCWGVDSVLASGVPRALDPEREASGLDTMWQVEWRALRDEDPAHATDSATPAGWWFAGSDPGEREALTVDILSGAVPTEAQDIEAFVEAHEGPLLLLAPELDAAWVEGDGEAVSRALDRAIARHVPLVRALARRERPLVTWLATATTEPGAVSGALPPLAAWTWGLYRALRLENPALSLRLVHLSNAGDGVAWRRLKDLVEAPPAAEIEFQIDGAGVRVPRLTAHAPILSAVPEPLEAGAHVVLGGVRGVGLRLAVELLERGADIVVSVSRSPTGEDWAKALERLTPAQATRWHHMVLDVVSPDAWKALDDRLAELGHSPAGVYLAAAVLRDEMCAELSDAAVRDVVRPKVLGAHGALEWLRRRGCIGRVPLVTFSSVSALAGNGGQSAYAAANAVLDALGAAGHACTIAWGPWSESGWVAGSPELATQLGRLGMRGLSDRHSFDRLWACRSTGTGHRVVADIDWARLSDGFGLADWAFWPQSADARRTSSGMPAVRPTTAEAVRRCVFDVVAAALGLDPLALASGARDDENLLSFGMDSLTALRIRNRLRTVLNVSLPTNLCHRFPTLRALADEAVRAWSDAPDSTAAAPLRLARGDAPTTSDPALRTLSCQQRRWLKLTELGYGRLLLPIRIARRIDDDSLLRRALARTIDRHEVMRWRCLPGNDGLAVVMPVEEVISSQDFATVDLSPLAPPAQRDALATVAAQMRTDVPDPRDGVSWSARIVRLAADDVLVLILAQHLELDGMSVTLFAEDLHRALSALETGTEPWTSPAGRYADYVAWQQDYLRSSAAVADRAYFAGLYLGRPGPTLLPGAAPMVPTPCADAICSSFPVEPLLWHGLRARASALSVTPFAMLCGAYFELVASIAGRTDLTVGTIVSGRSEDMHDELIGPFVAPFPLALDIAGLDAAQVVRRCQDLVVAINARGHFPPAEMVNHAPPFLGLPEETYFTDPFLMLNNYRQVEAGGGLEVLECLAPVDGEVLTALSTPVLPEIAGLFLIIDENRDTIRLNFWHHIHRFDRSMVADWALRYLDILTANATDD